MEERFPGISRDRCREELHLVDERDQIFTGAAAVRETLARLPNASLSTLPFRLPGGWWLADWGYRCIARNRGWLSRWIDSTTDDR